MSDLESRLRDVLDERAFEAPDATGLAAGARRRLRRRRTTRALVAAAVVAAAVPLGLSQLGGGGGAHVIDEPVVATDPPGQVEPGHRTESWHEVTFEVPAEWGYGGVTGWCAGGSTLEEALPVVTRPDSVTPAIACSPGSGYGVTIGSSELVDPAYESGHVWQYDSQGVDVAMYPDGAWLGYWYDAGAIVTVVTPDRALTQRVVDSAKKIDGVDANECPVSLGEAEALTGSTSDSFSICRYDEADLLTASRRYVGDDARVVEETILRSPAQRTDYDCPDSGALTRTAILRGGGYVATVVTDASCEGHNGVFLSGTVNVVDDAVREAVDLTRVP